MKLEIIGQYIFVGWKRERKFYLLYRIFKGKSLLGGEDKKISGRENPFHGHD
jgi:hypothetical protein